MMPNHTTLALTPRPSQRSPSSSSRRGSLRGSCGLEDVSSSLSEWRYHDTGFHTLMQCLEKY